MKTSQKPMFKSRTEAIDAYELVYSQRIKQEQESKLSKAVEDATKLWIIQDLKQAGLIGDVGTNWEVTIDKGVNATLEDFDAFTKFVAANRIQGAFGLLYRRLNQETIRVWEGRGVAIPGLGEEPYEKLHHARRET